VGTALGPQGVNIMEFCKAFNAKTSAKDQEGLIIPVVDHHFLGSFLHVSSRRLRRCGVDQAGLRIGERLAEPE